MKTYYLIPLISVMKSTTSLRAVFSECTVWLNNLMLTSLIFQSICLSCFTASLLFGASHVIASRGAAASQTRGPVHEISHQSTTASEEARRERLRCRLGGGFCNYCSQGPPSACTCAVREPASRASQGPSEATRATTMSAVPTCPTRRSAPARRLMITSAGRYKLIIRCLAVVVQGTTI